MKIEKKEHHRNINDIIDELKSHPDYMFSDILTIDNWVQEVFENQVDEDDELREKLEKDGIVSFDGEDYILHKPELVYNQKFWKSKKIQDSLGSIICNHYNYGLPFEHIKVKYDENNKLKLFIHI